MTARTSLVALLLIVALLGAVVVLLDEPGGSLDPGAAVAGALPATDPETVVTPDVTMGEENGEGQSRLVAQAPALPPLTLDLQALLLPTGEVRGRLVDALGQPIPGEPVDLLALDDPWWTALRHEETPEVVDRGITDTEGQFVLAARAGARQVLHAGGLRWSRVRGIPVSAGDTVEIELADGLVLSGYVVEEETGQPVPGAWVGSFAGADKLLTQADERGFFSLSPLPDEPVLIGAFLEGFDIGFQEAAVPGWGAVEIALPPGRTIDGRVLDRQSNAPVAGAAVALQLKSVGRDGAQPDPFEGQRTLIEWTALTDDDGRFTLESCPSAQFRVTVSADGYVPSGSDRYSDRVLGPDQVLTVMLSPADAVVGQITVAADGSIAAGAQVLLSSASGPVSNATAEGDGRFTLDLATWDGRGKLVVSARDAEGRRASHRVRKRSSEVELALIEPLALDVLVTGPNGPVAGAQVAITSREAEPTLATTDGRGRARLVHALAGPDIATASVQARYGAAHSLAHKILLDDARPVEPVLLDLSAGAWIEGVVQDIYGAPLAYAMVSVRGRTSARSDSAGLFSIGPVDVDIDETVTLMAYAEGFRSTTMRDVSALQPVVLILEAVVTWQGKVSDAATGEPLDVFTGRVLVETLESGSSAWRTGAVTAPTSVPGGFVVEMDEAGTVKLQVRAPDYVTGESALVLFDGLNSPPWTDIFLTRAALLEVTVTDSAGRPVQGYALSAVPSRSAKKSATPQGKMRKKSKSSRTGGDGKVRFNLGAGGLFRLASGPGAWVDDFDVNVHPGVVTQRFLDVGGTGTVAVVVRDETGELMARPRASVRSIGSEHKHSVKRRLAETTDGERLVATGLPEGRYLVEVSQRGYVKVSQEVLVTAGGVARAEFELVRSSGESSTFGVGKGKDDLINEKMLKQLRALGYLDG